MGPLFVVDVVDHTYEKRNKKWFVGSRGHETGDSWAIPAPAPSTPQADRRPHRARANGEAERSPRGAATYPVTRRP